MSIGKQGVSQVTKIMGIVKDSTTKEPLPFVNVYFKGTNVGTTSGFDGKYSIESKIFADTLIASSVGYIAQHKEVKKNKFQVINFSLISSNIDLSEVIIRPGENPADILLRKVIQNKDINNPQKFDAYQYEVYNKIQIDANNVSEKFQQRGVFNQFKFVWDNMDTSTINGKAYLPLFLTETMSDFYYKDNPKTTYEVIKASRTSGIENESFSKYLGQMYQRINIYENYISLFEKNFISPIANFSLSYYKYYLVDSTFIDNQWCFQIMFKPKRKQELTFTGNIWVHDTSFAIKKVEVKIVDDANLNFINDVVSSMEYTLVDGEYWMLSKEAVVIDFNILENTKKSVGFFGHKTSIYRNFVINKPMGKDFYQTATNVVVEKEALNKSEDYWTNSRPEELTHKEQGIYNMVDSITKVPVFRTYIDIVQMITTGYYVWEQIELGPYMSTFSMNSAEGQRFRLGGRTSNAFSTKIMLSTYAAYGIKDNDFKYGAGLLYMISKNPRRTFSVEWKNDYEQLGLSQNAFREDFLLASLFKRNPSDKLTRVNEIKSNVEYEWYSGFSTTLGFNNRIIKSFNNTDFIVNDYNGGKINLKSITSSEISINSRFAYKEKFLMGEFERTSLGTIYPIFELNYSYSLKDFLGSDFEYNKLQIGIKQWFNVGSYGWSKYMIEAGQIFGTLPYPLLKMHEGNETYYTDEYAFNTMNYYEFISDKYLSVFYTHHFDGLFLNRIPLMRKLKWREVAFAKGLIGDLNIKNQNYSAFPFGLAGLKKPYFEAGFGIENIFRILRIDAVWRLSYLDHPNINKFSLMGTIQFYF